MDQSRRSRGLISIGIAAVLAITLGACGSDGAGAPEGEGLVGTAAPALSGEDLVNGGTLDLASMKGKPTAVVFWLYACPHCKDTVPVIQEAWEEASPDANILTVGLEYESTEGLPIEEGYDSPEAFVESVGLTLPSIGSEWATQSGPWMLEGVPAVYVLDADHVVRAAFVGGEMETSDIIEAVAEQG